MPSLTQLEYIVAVEKHRHFGKAAEACHVTQPTLSMQIQKVEEEIGYPLFDRLKKPIVPTTKGTRFITQAKVLLHEHHKLVDLSRSQSGELSGDLRLGVIPTIAPYLLPLFLESFSKEFPKVHLFVDELKTDTILQMLAEDQLDAGILATPLHEPGLKERPLYYEPFSLYVSRANPLNARKRIKEDDLDAEHMWLLEDGHCFRNQIVRYCSLKGKEGVFPNVRFEGGNIDTLRYLVRKSNGYTLVPALFVETLTESERRDHVREFEKPVPAREVSLVYRRDQWKSDVLKALEEAIRKQLPKGLQTSDPKRMDVLDVRK
ncbi:MAG: hydrogen peroxide-inducible genes activator [Bdellovibrionales bacterium]|nr:hydrogen peroxide-inducible genes activator [Bdellovibrionales bacterium]